jgi:hypothetical protein
MQFLNRIFELWLWYHKGLPVDDFHLDIVAVLSANESYDGFESCSEKISTLLASIVKDVGSECHHLPFVFSGVSLFGRLELPLLLDLLLPRPLPDWLPPLPCRPMVYVQAIVVSLSVNYR